jgi:hypothetical protein
MKSFEVRPVKVLKRNYRHAITQWKAVDLGEENDGFGVIMTHPEGVVLLDIWTSITLAEARAKSFAKFFAKPTKVRIHIYPKNALPAYERVVIASTDEDARKQVLDMLEQELCKTAYGKSLFENYSFVTSIVYDLNPIGPWPDPEK